MSARKKMVRTATMTRSVMAVTTRVTAPTRLLRTAKPFTASVRCCWSWNRSLSRPNAEE